VGGDDGTLAFPVTICAHVLVFINLDVAEDSFATDLHVSSTVVLINLTLLSTVLS
jgi:hypothetical protein